VKLKIVFFILFLNMIFQHNIYGVTRIVCTCALVNPHYEIREQQYIKAFTMLHALGNNNFYIIESIKKSGPTFLENYSNNVFYSTINDASLKNQGVNEAMTLLEGCKHFNFSDDDMIVKLTGRYSLTSNYFFNVIEANPSADAIVKIDSDGHVHTLGFAMKYKHLKKMYSTINFAYINRHMIPIEHKVGDYIKEKKNEPDFKVYYIDKLDIKADLLGSTACPGATGIIIF